MECSIYQNYTASEVLVQGLAGVVNQVSHAMIMMMIVMMVSGGCGGDGQGTEGDAPEV